jgi:hypothetical protein
MLIGHRFLPSATSAKPCATCREKCRRAAPCAEELQGRLIRLHNEHGVVDSSTGNCSKCKVVSDYNEGARSNISSMHGSYLDLK